MTRIDQYHFYEREWESYEQLRESFKWEIPDRFNMATYVCDRWARKRGRVAFFAADESGNRRTFTFRDIQRDANRLANYLSEAGITAGDRIGVCLGQRPEAAIAHVAAWKLGAVSVPLSTQFGDDALAYRLDDCRATACVVGESSVETFRSIRDDLASLDTVVTVDCDPVPTETTWDAVQRRSPKEFETAETDADDDALIIYTSGTTGNPKGVLHAQRLLLGHLPAFAESFLEEGTSDGTVFWTPVEWSWIGSLFSLVMPALYYGRPVVAYDADRFDAESAFELLERYEVTDLGSPPTALRMMMQVDAPAERYGLESVRRVGAGGEAVGERVIDWAEETFDGAVVEELYGQTEANLVVADCGSLERPRVGKMGLAAPGHEVAIVDPETAEPIDEPGTVGEIAIRYESNPVCFEEYWEKPDLTDRKVRNGWLLTEDLGAVDEDGFFSFEGRKDDVIITSGYCVSPQEVEDVIADHPAVVDAAVIGVPDDERGTVPKAFIVTTEEDQRTPELKERIGDRVKDGLAPYEYPRTIEFVDELPKTSTGKVRRQTLRERERITDS